VTVAVQAPRRNADSPTGGYAGAPRFIGHDPGPFPLRTPDRLLCVILRSSCLELGAPCRQNECGGCSRNRPLIASPRPEATEICRVHARGWSPSLSQPRILLWVRQWFGVQWYLKGRWWPGVAVHLRLRRNGARIRGDYELSLAKDVGCCNATAPMDKKAGRTSNLTRK
jgi:hypothetical protein